MDERMPNPKLCEPCRQTAAGSLRSRAEEFRRKAVQLEALALIADRLHPGSLEEEAMWLAATGVVR